MTGKDWYDDAQVMIDNETKITEFDYENHIDPNLLKTIDTNSKEFKQLVRVLNLFS